MQLNHSIQIKENNNILSKILVNFMLLSSLTYSFSNHQVSLFLLLLIMYTVHQRKNLIFCTSKQSNPNLFAKNTNRALNQHGSFSKIHGGYPSIECYHYLVKLRNKLKKKHIVSKTIFLPVKLNHHIYHVYKRYLSETKLTM